MGVVVAVGVVWSVSSWAAVAAAPATTVSTATSSGAGRPRVRTWRITSITIVTDRAAPKATRNAAVWLSWRLAPKIAPRPAAYVAQITAATAIQPANHRRGCDVIPDVMVSALRPPGMNRAVTSSGPPRVRIWLRAHSMRAANFGRFAA